jgi:hypothetical protein
MGCASRSRLPGGAESRLPSFRKVALGKPDLLAMGIKFHCPNGHKLNVKSFLAGKKGVCPKCGTKVRIPVASEAGLADADLEETDASQHPAKSNGSGAVATVRAPAVSAAPAEDIAAPAGMDGANDPIAEAPTAIWYVRPPTGGQYGPARGDIMRKWISEGRVSSDSLVWREGWTDWQNAGKLFPALQAAGSAPVATTAVPVVSATVPISPRASARTAVRYEAKKRDSTGTALAILVGLGLLCLVLGAILVYVAFYR